MRLYISNIDYDISTAELKAVFEKIGVVKDCFICRDKTTGRSRGFGFVTFENDADACRALDDLDGYILEDRPLKIKEAYSRDNEGRRE